MIYIYIQLDINLSVHIMYTSSSVCIHEFLGMHSSLIPVQEM